MSIHIYGAFIDYLREQGREADLNKPMIEFKAELTEWKRLYNNR